MSACSRSGSRNSRNFTSPPLHVASGSVSLAHDDRQRERDQLAPETRGVTQHIVPWFGIGGDLSNARSNHGPGVILLVDAVNLHGENVVTLSGVQDRRVRGGDENFLPVQDANPRRQGCWQAPHRDQDSREWRRGQPVDAIVAVQYFYVWQVLHPSSMDPVTPRELGPPVTFCRVATPSRRRRLAGGLRRFCILRKIR